jgi:hypothetical protein
VSLPNRTAKGYLRKWFDDAFARYCALRERDSAASDLADVTGCDDESYAASPQGANVSVTPVTDLFSRSFSPFSIRHTPDDVTDKKDGNPFDNQRCDGCDG